MGKETSSTTTIAKVNKIKLRSFERHETRTHAIVHSRGRFQSVVIRDISRGGMRLENAFGLMPRDLVTIELLSGRNFQAKVAWSVAPFCGTIFEIPLAEHDSVLTIAARG